MTPVGVSKVFENVDTESYEAREMIDAVWGEKVKYVLKIPVYGRAFLEKEGSLSKSLYVMQIDTHTNLRILSQNMYKVLKRIPKNLGFLLNFF